MSELEDDGYTLAESPEPEPPRTSLRDTCGVGARSVELQSTTTLVLPKMARFHLPTALFLLWLFGRSTRAFTSRCLDARAAQ
jgi:hypothetical protein